MDFTIFLVLHLRGGAIKFGIPFTSNIMSYKDASHPKDLSLSSQPPVMPAPYIIEMMNEILELEVKNSKVIELFSSLKSK